MAVKRQPKQGNNAYDIGAFATFSLSKFHGSMLLGVYMKTSMRPFTNNEVWSAPTTKAKHGSLYSLYSKASSVDAGPMRPHHAGLTTGCLCLLCSLTQPAHSGPLEGCSGAMTAPPVQPASRSLREAPAAIPTGQVAPRNLSSTVTREAEQCQPVAPAAPAHV